MDQPQPPSYAVPHLAGPVLRRAGAEVHWLWFAALMASSLITSALLYAGLTAAAVDLVGTQGYLLVYAGLSSLVASAAQWLVLRRYAPISWAWIPATVAASVAAGALAYGIRFQDWSGSLPSALAIAASQALVLSRRLRGAGLWLPAAALAVFLPGTLFSQLVLPFVNAFGTGRVWIFSLGSSVAGALIHAAIEGAALRRLLRDNATWRQG